jgi:hypothetical protein
MIESAEWKLDQAELARIGSEWGWGSPEVTPTHQGGNIYTLQTE